MLESGRRVIIVFGDLNMKIKIKAPAKINLGLEILGKLPDGYHEVDFIMQTVGLYDYVTVELTENKEINITCNKKIDCDIQNNIAYKAAEVFFEHTNKKSGGINIHIEKNIPISAGLAGGSSNGAAIFVALDKIFGTNLELSELMKLGAKIGSDIPFCMLGSTARAKDTGVDLVPISPMPDCYVLLVKPDLSVSTKEAYEKADKLGSKTGAKIDMLMQCIENQDLLGIGKNLFNRFEDIIFQNIIKDIKSSLLNKGALGASMSGSGPTVFGIFDNESAANKCFNYMKSVYKETFLCRPTNHGAIIVCDE